MDRNKLLESIYYHPPATSQHESIVFATTSKAASTYLSKVFKRIFSSVGIHPMDAADIGSKQGFGVASLNLAKSNYFSSKGYFYTGFRCASDIGSLDELPKDIKVILVVRDPRDLAISRYFSVAYSHVVPKPGPLRDSLLKERKYALEQGVEKMAIIYSEGYKNNIEEYLEHFYDVPNTILLTYEEMVSNFKSFLLKAIFGTQICPPIEVIEQIVNEASSPSEEEDIYRHKRQVTPGDHKRKLSREVIDKINKTVGPLLTKLGYSL
jgi:hypothetical protein